MTWSSRRSRSRAHPRTLGTESISFKRRAVRVASGREATLETNRAGYGSVHLAETRLAGTTGAFVILWPANDAARSTGIIATDGTLLD